MPGAPQAVQAPTFQPTEEMRDVARWLPDVPGPLVTMDEQGDALRITMAGKIAAVKLWVGAVHDPRIDSTAMLVAVLMLGKRVFGDYREISERLIEIHPMHGDSEDPLQ